jgi:GrpB-like predicted nucleotidyltransferase (UPF0157 family)/GNAT superfamily N-acetyltransferase
MTSSSDGANSKPAIVVESYRDSWIDDYNLIRALVWPKIQDIALAIEHVGSTSVPGLSAKPIIDVDVIVESVDKMPMIIERLCEAGYEHRGDLGIEGREAFHAPTNSVRQNFYVCLDGSLALRNHLILRDHLRENASARRAYGDLKQNLAARFAGDIDAYVEAKTDLILKILAQHAVPEWELNLIRNANLKPLLVETAALADVDAVLSLIGELSNWLKSKGILQWSQSYPREKIVSDVNSNFVHVVRDGDQISATVTLSDHRDVYWRDFPGEAVYLHRLAIHRSFSCKHLGSRMLAWSEERVKARGVPLLRLDCDSQNTKLRQYYLNHGFEFCGLRRVDEYNMEFALFEKSVTK